MVIRRVRLLRTICICAVWVCTCCKGESTLYIWGTEWQTASPILVRLTLPEVDPETGSMAPLKYDVVDRGVTGIWQSPSGNLYYWKTTGLFVRTPEGTKSYVRFREMMPFEYGNQLIESPNKAWLAGVVGRQIVFSRNCGKIWGEMEEYISNPNATL